MSVSSQRRGVTEQSAEELVRAYYDALDSHDYDRLEGILAPGFVQIRPDVTLEGRERFVAFMRDERPETATSHPLDAVYAATSEESEDSSGYAARGRVVTDDGRTLTRFVDVFSFENGKIARLETYTD
jgi:ketosteroid isomerase-like protein